MELLHSAQALIEYQHLYWREPMWFVLALQPLLVVMARRLWRRKRLAAYVDRELQAWVIVTERGAVRKILSKNTAYVLAWLLLAVAAAGPRLPQSVPGMEQVKGADIMLVVDVSRSMQATDVQPNRLRRARLELFELVRQARGHRIGMIVYAARPHVYFPLTLDHAAVNYYLDNLETLALPTMGSRPVAAIEMAYDHVKGTKDQASIVLISDGDFTLDPQVGANGQVDTEKEDFSGLSARLRQAGIPLYVLGAGTTQGEAIPIPGGWLEHEGRPVISRMNEGMLQQLAAMNGGAYSAIRDDNSDWRIIYENGIAGLTPTLDDVDDKRVIWRELFHLPLLLATVLLWLSMMPYRLPLARVTDISTFVKRTGVPVCLALIAMLAVSDTYAAVTESDAYQHYASGDYQSAAQIYKKLPGFAGRFGEGASLYELGAYAEAVNAFSQSVLQARTDAARGAALYNLGNSYFKTGNYAAAIAVYKDALLYQPHHQASKTNLSFSENLQKAVEQHLRQSGSSRTGRGPVRAPVNAFTDINPEASLSVDDSQDTPETPIPLPELPGVDDKTLRELIDKGLAHIKLVAIQKGEDVPSQTSAPVDIIDARQRMLELEEQQHRLWKRLFEMEEGFPASLSSPKAVPGAQPW